MSEDPKLLDAATPEAASASSAPPCEILFEESPAPAPGAGFAHGQFPKLGLQRTQ